jgi:uncharacterized protein HemX
MQAILAVLLAALPFGLYLLWLRRDAEPSGALLALTALLVALGAGFAVWYGLRQDTERDAAYVPARIEDGRIVPGRGETQR